MIDALNQILDASTYEEVILKLNNSISGNKQAIGIARIQVSAFYLSLLDPQ